MSNNVIFYWSGGKDSAMAFHDICTLPQYRNYHIDTLLTTLTNGYDRISGHGVRRTVLERQAACMGMNLHKTYIPQKCTMEQYEAVMMDALTAHKRIGTNFAATGDIFMDKRRLVTFQKTGMRGCFPLWQKDAREQAQRFIQAGFQAYVVCVDASVLDQSYVGRLVDQEFLSQLPIRVDACGENGEYHTFVFDGPTFHEPVQCELGEVVFREGFYFCDIALTG